MDLASQNINYANELRDKRLICEARFEQSDVDILRRELLPLGRNAWRYDSLAAILTVGTGIYHYDAGNLWTGFEQLSNPADYSWWGERFEIFVTLHGTLETFSHLGGHRFVAPILAHGGIPQSCLPDFFLAITSHGESDLSGQEMLKQLESHPSWIATTDKPVRRFLESGGEVAEDFVARFLDLWGSYEGGDTDAKSGLPDRVVTAFSNWYATHRPRQRLNSTKRPKPELCLEPAGAGVFIRLPRCSEHAQISSSACWEVLGQKLAVTREHNIECLPQRSYELRCLDWQFFIPGIEENSSPLFFDPANGRAITDPKQRRLPEFVWAIVPEGTTSRPEPLYIDDLPRWRGFVVAVFDLSGSATLELLGEQYEIRKPFFTLASDTPIRNLQTVQEVPVYSSVPLILWKGQANLSLTRNNQPQGNIDIEAHELPVLIDGLGEFELHLRGPLGQNLRKHFVLVPGLSVQVSPEVMWPSASRITWTITSSIGSIRALDGSNPPFVCVHPSCEFLVCDEKCTVRMLAEVPRVKWRVAAMSTEQVVEFSTSTLEVGIDELCRAHYPLLEVTLGRTPAEMQINLVEKQKKGPMVEGKRQQAFPRSSWYFDLRAVRDDLLVTTEPRIYELAVALNQSPSVNISAIKVRPQWALTGFRVTWRKVDLNHLVHVVWREVGRVVAGRWLVLIPEWRSDSSMVLAHELSQEERESFEWRLPLGRIRPGRYLARAVHAPWGCENWLAAVTSAQMRIDIYPENWANTFSSTAVRDNHSEKLEAYLAHWNRPDLVPLCPIDVAALSPEDAAELLKHVLCEGAPVPSGILHLELKQIIFRSPDTLTSILNSGEKISQEWFKFLPSIEILQLVPNENDKSFIRELAFQYDVLGTAAMPLREKYSRRRLSEALKNWCSQLTRNRPPLFDVIWLCERHRIFEGQRNAMIREYKALRDTLSWRTRS